MVSIHVWLSKQTLLLYMKGPSHVNTCIQYLSKKSPFCLQMVPQLSQKGISTAMLNGIRRARVKIIGAARLLVTYMGLWLKTTVVMDLYVAAPIDGLTLRSPALNLPPPMESLVSGPHSASSCCDHPLSSVAWQSQPWNMVTEYPLPLALETE